MKNTAARKGFTLIELLIVIALLGALAVGLLATIDPFEQLKKGRDTSTRNTVSEFYNSLLRYYAIKADFPWQQASQANWPSAAPLYTAGGSGTAWVQSLIDAGELKNGFVDLAGTGNLAKIYITETQTDRAAVCFQPQSKSFQVDPNTMYDQFGVTAAGCKSAPGGAGTADCYFCVQ